MARHFPPFALVDSWAPIEDLGSILCTPLGMALHSRPFRLSPRSQAKSYSGVSQLKPKFQLPVLPTAAGAHLRLGSAPRWPGLFVLVSLYSACCKLAAALSSEPLKLSVCPGWSPSWWKVFPGEESFLLPQLPPRVAGFVQILFFFSLSSYQLCVNLSCSFGCMRSSTIIPLVFCENCSTCRCISYVFVGGGDLHILLFHHLHLCLSIAVF